MEQEIEVIREQEEQEIEIQNENITVDVVVNNNYEDLENLPQINNIELIGNLSSQDLGLQPAGNYVTDSNYIHTDNNFTNTYKNNVDLNTRDRHTHANKAVLDGISSSDITNWNNKSDFSGNYNDLSNKPTIPTKLSELESDSSHELVTSVEKTTWNNKSDFSGSYNDLTDKPTIPDVSNFITKDVNNLTYYTLSSNLATVATSGSYNDLNNTPTIPAEVTETTVSNWGFTKNVGTITGITMNSTSMGTSGVVDLGTVITSHQDISGKLDTSKVKNSYSTTSGDVYDVTYINSTVGDIESLLAEV